MRAAVVRPDATVAAVHHRPVLPSTPRRPASSSSTPRRWPSAALDVARAALAEGGPVAAVGITNQRASTIVWDRATGEPVGPGLGWQDLRTVGDCLVLQGEGIRLAPNESATKARHLLDPADPDRSRDLCFGTVDTWVAWHLSERRAPRDRPVQRRHHRPAHARRRPGWSDKVLEALRIPPAALPARGRLLRPGGRGHGPGEPPAGRRPRSPRSPATSRRRWPARAACGRAWPRSRSAPAGCSTSASGPTRPPSLRRAEGGSFPIVAWRRAGELTWGCEGIILAAGTNVEWLRDDLGIIDDRRGVRGPRRVVRRHRRRRLRARPARPGHAPVGLRRPRHAARHHPGHRPGRARPGRAGGRRPAGRRPGRRRPRPTPACPSTACGSTGA